MHCFGLSFGAQQIRGANLRSGRPKRHCSLYAFGVCNTASGDNGNVHRVYQLWNQGKSADLSADIPRQKKSAMATCFKPLRDNGIDALRLQPERFVHGCGGRQYLPAPPSYTRHQLLCWQAKMKTHHRRLEVRQHIRCL